MNKPKKFISSNQGVAAIEFAILLPFLLLLLFGVFELSRYIMIVRKADQVTNDMGFLLSREGSVATYNPVTNTYGGGATKKILMDMFSSIGPLIMYPYPFQLANGSTFGNNYDGGNSYIYTSFVGLPIFDSSEQCTADGIDRTTARVMWVASSSDFGNTNTFFPGKFTSCIGDNCPKACDGHNYKSFYQDNFDTSGNGTTDRADIIFPGQSFIVVDFDYDYSSVLGTSATLGWLLPGSFSNTNSAGHTVNGFSIHKAATYATRATNHHDPLNKNPFLPTDLYNDMQYCLDCITSSVATQSTSGSDFNGGLSTKSVRPERQACKKYNKMVPGTNDFNSGGCAFK